MIFHLLTAPISTSLPILGALTLGLATQPQAALIALVSTAALAQPIIEPEQPGLPQPGIPAGKFPDRPEHLAPSAENAPLENEITPELDDAVTRGLAALANKQRADGSFGEGRFGRNVAVTSLACLAFMADGHVPGRGKYGPIVQLGLENVLSNSTETGLIAGESGNGPMYGHGFATLFLGEVYGMIGGDDSDISRRTHDALLRACRLIERTQNSEGGWRYNPVPFDADVSVTICQIMALRSARNAGIEVPKSVIDRAVVYVRNCQNKADGGFMYQLPSGISAWPRSAAGVASLYYAGIYSDDALDRGIAYLAANAAPDSPARSEAHYWYGMYYTAQSMYLAGGSAWANWWPSARTELLNRQTADGQWNDPAIGNAYGSAMALIVLQMPKRYLPIFQK